MKTITKFILLAAIVFFAPNSYSAISNIDKQGIKSIDVLENGGFENGKAGWTASGGSFQIVTGSNALVGSTSARFNASASGQTFCSKLYSVPKGIQGLPSLGFFKYITTEGTNKYKINVYDGSSNLIGTNTIDSSSTSNMAYSPFLAPSSGTIKLCVESTGDAADIDLDFGHFGSDTRLSDINQGRFIAGAEFSGSFTDKNSFTSASDISSSGFTTTYLGSAISNGTTSNTGFTIPVMQAGDYFITVSTVGQKAGSTACAVGFLVTDGTSVTPSAMSAHFTSEQSTGAIVGKFTYNSTQVNKVFRVQAVTTANSASCIARSVGSFAFYISYMPSATETGLRIDQLGWKVDANISGANISLGTSNVASYAGIENASLTLSNSSGNGNIQAKIPCSSTNASSGTTCSVGNESVGVSFEVPSAGDVVACASFSHGTTIQAVSGDRILSTFQIVETPNNAQTILQEGKSRVGSGNRNDLNVAGANYKLNPNRVCGTFSFASSGQKTLRLMYEQTVVNGTTNEIIADADASNGQRDIHWEVYPISYLSGALPRFKGMLTTNSDINERIERASVTSYCTSSPCTIAGQSGSWLSNITRSAVGSYAANINTGIFSELSSCVCTSTGSSDERTMCTLSATATSTATTFYFKTWTFGGAAIDTRFNLICMGKN